MNILLFVSIFFISYMIGSISFARIVTRVWSGKNVTDFEIPVEGGEDHYKVISIGANSVSSQLGAKAGMLVSALDIFKVFFTVFLTKYYFPLNSWAPIIAAIGGMIGHVWPVYYKFHGGSGYSAIMGSLLIFDPLAILLTPLIGLFFGMLVFRNLIVATISWIWLLIPWFWLRKPENPEFIFYAVALNILFILAMIPEIKTGIMYKKKGMTDEYGRGSLSSNPMGRGFLKMANVLGFMKDIDTKKNPPNN
jgi:acyl phosphate:glycerol-3-phosphate acyltransferase